MIEKDMKKVNAEIEEDLLKTDELADEDMGDITGGAVLSRTRILKANSLESDAKARVLSEEGNVDTTICENCGATVVVHYMDGYAKYICQNCGHVADF